MMIWSRYVNDVEMMVPLYYNIFGNYAKGLKSQVLIDILGRITFYS